MVGLPDALRSGGQSGADLGALYAGLALGYVPGTTLGGWMPKGFKTEFGTRHWMKTRFGMQESPSENYLVRTRANVEEADQVLIFGEVLSAGSRATIRLCEELLTPYWVNPTLQTLRKLAWGNVMVAGNRESGNRGIEDWVNYHLRLAWVDAAVTSGLKAVVTVPPTPHRPRLWSPEDQWSPLEMEGGTDG